MTDDEPGPEVPIHCTACDTTTRIPLEDVADAIERHNEQLHDGEDIAQVDPAIADQLADIVVDDLGLLEEP